MSATLSDPAGDSTYAFGTPLKIAGQSILHITARDKAGNVATADLTLTVDPTGNPPVDPTPGNNPPVADAGGPNYTTVVGAPVTLDGSGSTDADGDPLTYRWIFDDDTTATGARVSHAWDGTGRHLVYLEVSDGKDSSDPTYWTARLLRVC